MTFLEYYIIFCLATAICALIELLHPAVVAQSKLFKIDKIYVIYLTFFILTTVIAPLVFLSCIIPSYGEKFRKTLAKSLFPD